MRANLGDSGPRAQLQSDLDALLKDVNQQVESFERLQFLAVVREPWLIENGLLTPTMKIKRSKLEDSYGPKTEGWYSAGQPVIWEA